MWENALPLVNQNGAAGGRRIVSTRRSVRSAERYPKGQRYGGLLLDVVTTAFCWAASIWRTS